ncbi:penicillin-binding protein 2 [Bacteroidota bacterium]
MNENQFGSRRRERIILFIVTGFFALVVLNLFNMQIIQQYSYEEKSNENSVRQTVKNAPRGIFYDRDFNVILSNKPSFMLQIIPALYDKECSKIIENMLGVDEGYINKILSETRMYSQYTPRKIKRDVNFQFIAWFEENAEMLPGVEYVVDIERDYAFDLSASHIFGYIKEISPDQYRKSKGSYDLGDYVGFKGLEKSYEELLRGEKGITYTLVDAKQKVISQYKEGIEDKPPVKGNDLVLSIDSDVQRLAEKYFIGKRGAFVAIEPVTGEILAFVSAPEYNLDDFSTVTSQQVWENLSRDPDKPLFNRATMSIYSPGSTYKLISALAGLEEGIINTSDYVTCKGGIHFGDRFFRCLESHGRVNIVRAIEKSCNTYFYTLIQKIGLEKWAEYSRKFGFGSKTGVDIGEEIPGVVPDAKFYDQYYGKGRWTRGLLLNLGIGQGELSVTPIQLAKYAALLANNGRSVVPHFVKGIVYSDLYQFVPINYEKIEVGISQASFDIVKEGMFKVVNGEGSAQNIKMKNIKIAGKTGTVQNPFGEDHAFFIGFAPFDDPKIAVAVVVENVGYGSTHAAPIARNAIVTYMRKLKKSTKSNLASLNRD